LGSKTSAKGSGRLGSNTEKKGERGRAEKGKRGNSKPSRPARGFGITGEKKLGGRESQENGESEGCAREGPVVGGNPGGLVSSTWNATQRQSEDVGGGGGSPGLKRKEVDQN